MQQCPPWSIPGWCSTSSDSRPGPNEPRRNPLIMPQTRLNGPFRFPRLFATMHWDRARGESEMYVAREVVVENDPEKLDEALAVVRTSPSWTWGPAGSEDSRGNGSSSPS